MDVSGSLAFAPAEELDNDTYTVQKFVIAPIHSCLIFYLACREPRTPMTPLRDTAAMARTRPQGIVL